MAKIDGRTIDHTRNQHLREQAVRRAYERDPEKVEQWVKQDYPTLRRRAKKLGATIFFLDEAGFRSEPILGRSYGLKGQAPIVNTPGQRQRVSAMNAVSAKGGFWCNVYTGMLNAGRFVEFLKDFRKGGRDRVFMVVDGHPSHHAKVVQKYVLETKGWLELHFLPPYAPDLNPDEFIWQHGKTNGVAKRHLKQNESLKEGVKESLAAIKAMPKLSSHFFVL